VITVHPEPHGGGGIPAVHPEPPGDLHDRVLPLIPASGPWARAFRLDRDPLYFGRGGDQRFDDPAREFGVCYCGADEACAFIETLPAQVTVGATSILGVREAALQARGWATVELLPQTEPLWLVDMTGPGLAHLGANADLSSCPDYAVPQRWSRALWSHPQGPSGLLYRARHDPSLLSIALFDRADGRVAMTSRGAWSASANATLLRRMLARYRVQIIPDARS